MPKQPLKIVYCTPALYMAGGVERVLTLKANYFAEHFGYDITIILTEGKDKPLFYPLSDKIKVINLDINFEELWTCSFVKKVYVYLAKQRIYKKRLTVELMRVRPDITISLLRREINFLTSIHDGSKKIGELHVNRANYRNFEKGDSNLFKNLFAKFWMISLVSHLQQLNRFVVLTEEDKLAWSELSNVVSIPNPITFETEMISPLTGKRVIAVGRYTYQKGFDLLLKAWSIVEKQCPEWSLVIYGAGDRTPYIHIAEELGLDNNRCRLNSNTSDIFNEYMNSSLMVMSSRFEGLSMVMLEAMSCGLPVVSFACPCGPKDVITNEVNGLLVPKEDVYQLARSMIRVMSSPQLAKKMSIEAKKKSSDFRISVLADRWKYLFESI